MREARGEQADGPLAQQWSRRDLVVGGTLGAAALLAAGASRDVGASTLASGPPLQKAVPERVERWKSSPFENLLIPKGEDAYQQTYDQVLTRYYTSDVDTPIILLVAYGSAQAGNAQLHRPEVCYPAAGFRLRGWPDISLALGATTIQARSMTALAPGRIEQILYWTRIGADFPTSSLGQRWAILRHSLRGHVPDGILVRVSAIEPDRARGVAVLQRFARSLVRASGADLRSLLTGGA